MIDTARRLETARAEGIDGCYLIRTDGQEITLSSVRVAARRATRPTSSSSHPLACG
jgi:hypothetical protein